MGYIQTRTFTNFFKGEIHEVQAREEIVAHIMNKEGVGKSKAIGLIFDTGFEEWANGANDEVRELWGLAKLEQAARVALSRQKRISEIAQIVGEDAILEEAVRMGMDEDEAKGMIERSTDATERNGGASKTKKMQQWLGDFLGSNGPTPIGDIKVAAIEAGVVSDNVFEKESDWNLMSTVVGQYGYRGGSERGVWSKK